MEPNEIIGLWIFGTCLVVTAIYFIVIYRKQQKRIAARPSNHRGEYQSQKGREFKRGVSNRSNSAEWGQGAGANLLAMNASDCSPSADSGACGTD